MIQKLYELMGNTDEINRITEFIIRIDFVIFGRPEYTCAVAISTSIDDQK